MQSLHQSSSGKLSVSPAVCATRQALTSEILLGTSPARDPEILNSNYGQAKKHKAGPRRFSLLVISNNLPEYISSSASVIPRS